ncbi:unnamed protein product [Ectocarpus sp. CCAP 1310/34]|nr:unnamed protein product [Ectocarpus sp. CCAP 1310/34]
MTMDGKTKSCLSALVVLLGAAIQADGFVVGPVAPVRTAGSSSSLTKASLGTSSRWATSSSKLQSSPYEEYMRTRQQKESGMAVSPEAEEKASMFDSYQASRNEQAAMPPAEKEKSLFESYMASRGGGAAPAPAPAAPSAPTPAASSSPSTELSPYEEYMQSRNKIKAAEAATTFEEKTKASAYEEYMAARRAKESGSDVPVADCVEEECSAEEVEQEAGLFASYMAGIKVEATTEEQVSYYDSHMASRKHVKDANADVTPQEAENVSLFDSYMASRNAADAARKTMPPAEAQKALFDDFQKESSPTPTTTSSKTPPGHKGTGGMADTRDPAPVKHEDPRKSIPAAPSFAEYLKSKRN